MTARDNQLNFIHSSLDHVFTAVRADLWNSYEETCMKDFNLLITDMETAVADFEDGSYTKIADSVY